jgi:hypothetical protein
MSKTVTADLDAETFERWAAFQRELRRPEVEITQDNCIAELDPDKRTRCRGCGTTDGTSYAVYDNIWAMTGLVPLGGVLCLACLARWLGRPLRLDDFPLARPINLGARSEILRACRGR